MDSLAIEYFQIANTITAFYVVQQFLFFTAIYKEPVLLAALCRRRTLAVCVTIATGATYAGVIVYCATMEFSVREILAQDAIEIELVRSICFGAMTVRLLVTGMLAASCAFLIGKLLKVE
ncbi:Uncharacterised protein [Halioglobus japonicus]|nr:Uncharacterised protein [Halioglobus japonicus]